MRFWLRPEERMNTQEESTRSCIIYYFKYSTRKGKNESERKVGVGVVTFWGSHKSSLLSLDMIRMRPRPWAFLRRPSSRHKARHTFPRPAEFCHVFLLQKILQTPSPRLPGFDGALRLLPAVPGTSDCLHPPRPQATTCFHLRSRGLSCHQAILCSLLESSATCRYETLLLMRNWEASLLPLWQTSLLSYTGRCQKSPSWRLSTQHHLVSIGCFSEWAFGQLWV